MKENIYVKMKQNKKWTGNETMKDCNSNSKIFKDSECFTVSLKNKYVSPTWILIAHCIVF